MRETVSRARDLIGCCLVIFDDQHGFRGGRIVETEAYCADAPASHAYGGRTRRNASMFLPPNHVYVYRSYGIHWCLNLVTADEGTGEAILIRGVEPLWGIDGMYERRGLTRPEGTHEAVGGVHHPADRRLTNGPGKLCQALGIDGSWDGVPLAPPEAAPGPETGTGAGITERRIGVICNGGNGCPPTVSPDDVIAGPRVGISRAVDRPWRFRLRGNRFAGGDVREPRRTTVRRRR